MQTDLTAEAIRFRDLKQRLVLLAGCHFALATVLTLEVLLAGEPYSSWIYATIQVAIAACGITILSGVRRGAAWSRMPLFLFCIVSLLHFPLSFFALGILWLLTTGSQPRLLTQPFPQQIKGNKANRSSFDDWYYLLGTILVYLTGWIFVHASL
jgi:hypothetical protein